MNGMTEIKYRQPIVSRDGTFTEWFYWGCIDGEWISWANQLNGFDTRRESQQYTRIKDRNKKEVFDGDVIKDITTGFFYRIHWIENGLAFGKTIIEKKGVHGHTTYLSDYYKDVSKTPNICKDIEVVGNIFENPDYLKEFNS